MKKYNVTGMSCAACSARVERAVSSVCGVTECSVNLLTGSMTVEGGAEEDVISAVNAAGYGASVAGKRAENSDTGADIAENAERKRIVARLVSSAVLLLILMYISMGVVMLGFPLPPILRGAPVAIALIQLILSTLILVINQRFFISGYHAVINRSPNMDTLVALGSGASYIWSIAVMFGMIFDPQNAEHELHGLYFESAAMILTLITVGKMLESYAKGKTANAIKSLMKLTPRTATVERDGAEVEIPSSEIRVGEIFVLRPGDSVPADGIVIDGASSMDESALTGESIPAEKLHGAHVYAGTVNLTGFLRCEASATAGDTVMSGIVRMVEDAAASKAPIAKVADRVAGIFVPSVLAVAFVTVVIWSFVNNSLGYALARGISVLVISCPCALGLATPVAIMVGSGIGARGGVLFKNATALESVGRARTVVFDKTGTITRGTPAVTELYPMGISEEELLSYAYSVEKMSEHPLASAVSSYAESRGVRTLPARNFKTIVGGGVYAECDGAPVFGGSLDLISTTVDVGEDVKALYGSIADKGATPVFFTVCGKLVGAVAIADGVKDDSAAAIAELRKMGIKTVMLTGDNARTANAVGAVVGVDEIKAHVLPDEKAAAVAEYSRDGKVIMVGDGINDAPALVSADVGMAIGRGTDIAIESADVVLMHSRLSDVVSAIRLGRATLWTIYGNLFWAFIYNLIGIPLAAGVFIPLLGWELEPMFGAAAMSLSSFSVVMNALRLNLKKIFKNEYTAHGAESSEGGERNDDKMEKTLKINGMMCPHCEARVRDLLLAFPGVSAADVSHKSGTARITVTAEVSDDGLKKLISDAGYEITDII